MGVAVHIAGTKDEAAAELEGIFAETVLAMSGGSCPVAGCGVVAAQEMEQGSGSQAHCAICFPLLVNQEREGDAGLFAEEARVMPVAESDGSETSPFLSEFRLVLAQLRDMLAAEHSTIVTEKDKDCGTAGPEGAESDLAAVAVGQDDPGEPRAE